MSTACGLQSKHFGTIFHVLFPLLLVAHSAYAAPAETASQSDSSSVNGSKPLQGQVQLDEQLPPASPNFGVGNKLDSQELESLTPGNIWHMIPKWMAGKWHSDEEITSFTHDYRTGKDIKLSRHYKSVKDVNHGEQRDKNGQIWSFGDVPSTSKIETADGMTYCVISQLERGLPNEPTYVSKSRFDEIQLNKKGKILRSAQCEALQTFEQIDDGMLNAHSVLKVFDKLGNPMLLEETDYILKRTAPYQDVDKKGELDLKKLFVEFLKQTGQEALIPGADFGEVDH